MKTNEVNPVQVMRLDNAAKKRTDWNARCYKCGKTAAAQVLRAMIAIEIENVKLAAASRTLVPALIAELRTERATVARLRAALESQRGAWEIIADEISRDPGRVGGQHVGHEPALAYATISVKHQLRAWARNALDGIKTALDETKGTP